MYRIQVQGLATRMLATGSKRLVIGVSGGLDSTQALIVCARTMDQLKLPRANILAYTMPGFATSTRTKSQAWQLMRAVGATAEEIDIKPSCLQMLKDIGHPFAKGKKVYDVTFENVQAGERTSHLFRLANFHGGMVVGTGDLSELALGWATYGVGDHMSHYNVNASVPKTLIQFLVGWVAESDEFSADVKRALKRVLETEISPELVPGSQKSEATVGPVRAAGLQPVLHPALRLLAGQGRVPRLARLARQVQAARDPQVARGVRRALLPQPVQAQRRAERAQGRLGRLAFAARRLARAVRRQRQRVAQGPRASACGRVKVFKS